MNLVEYKKNICRICLRDNVWMDWNTSLDQIHDITYKECYYKYSQLEHFETDPFTQMLCKNCCKALTNTHALILKILESHKLLQEAFSLNGQFLDDLSNSTSIKKNVDDIQYTPIEVEPVLIENEKEESIVVDDLKYDNSDDHDVSLAYSVTTKSSKQAKDLVAVCENANPKPKRKQSVRLKKKFEESLKDPSSSPLTKSKVRRMSKVETPRTVNDNKSDIIQKEISEKYLTVNCNVIEYDVVDENKPEDETANVETKAKKRYKENPAMCSFCSKILHRTSALRIHEEIHLRNRERKVTCQICGIKFYNKKNLGSHMRIHKENRVKRHKCEFCTKAFYEKGALNVHRRIHLGQMVKCNLCSKQYPRQVDLDKHMRSHSATTINSDIKKRSRYFVRCQYCDKSILSGSFKSHTAAHLNEPLMKCSLCDKEFFRRDSCVLHVKKVHQKNNDEYNDFIILYKKDRISHLFLEQKANILHIQSD